MCLKGNMVLRNKSSPEDYQQPLKLNPLGMGLDLRSELRGLIFPLKVWIGSDCWRLD